MFETKDSGKREEFESGMVRDTQENKTLYHLVFDGPMIHRWAELLTRGAKKYSEGNWMKAEGEAELNRFRSSAARHFVQWLMGEQDEDHAAAVMFNINGVEYIKRKKNMKAFGEFQAELRVDFDDPPLIDSALQPTCQHTDIYWDGQLGYVCEACGEAGVNRKRGAD